jgi:hypothetical protein
MRLKLGRVGVIIRRRIMLFRHRPTSPEQNNLIRRTQTSGQTSAHLLRMLGRSVSPYEGYIGTLVFIVRAHID